MLPLLFGFGLQTRQDKRHGHQCSFSGEEAHMLQNASVGRNRVSRVTNNWEGGGWNNWEVTFPVKMGTFISFLGTFKSLSVLGSGVLHLPSAGSLNLLGCLRDWTWNRSFFQLTRAENPLFTWPFSRTAKLQDTQWPTYIWILPLSKLACVYYATSSDCQT